MKQLYWVTVPETGAILLFVKVLINTAYSKCEILQNNTVENNIQRQKVIIIFSNPDFITDTSGSYWKTVIFCPMIHYNQTKCLEGSNYVHHEEIPNNNQYCTPFLLKCCKQPIINLSNFCGVLQIPSHFYQLLNYSDAKKLRESNLKVFFILLLELNQNRECVKSCYRIPQFNVVKGSRPTYWN